MSKVFKARGEGSLARITGCCEGFTERSNIKDMLRRIGTIQDITKTGSVKFEERTEQDKIEEMYREIDEREAFEMPEYDDYEDPFEEMVRRSEDEGLEEAKKHFSQDFGQPTDYLDSDNEYWVSRLFSGFNEIDPIANLKTAEDPISRRYAHLIETQGD